MNIEDSSLAIFQPPSEEKLINSRKWVTYQPKNVVNATSNIEFEIPNNSGEYIDLSKCMINLKYSIVNLDGSMFESPYNLADPGNPADWEYDDRVPVNLFLQSAFKKVDLKVGNVNVSSEVGNAYDYKAILDKLIFQAHSTQYANDKANVRQNALPGDILYFQSTVEQTDSRQGYEKYASWPEASDALKHRISASNIVDLSGPLFLDLCQQKKFLLNQVPLSFTFHQHSDVVRINTSTENTLTKKIIMHEVTLDICQVQVSPSVILKHNLQLEKNRALYPYWNSNIKTVTVPVGTSTFEISDIFKGNIPSDVVIGCVPSTKYVGSPGGSRFEFGENIKTIQFMVDGVTVPEEKFDSTIGGEDKNHQSSECIPRKTDNLIRLFDFNFSTFQLFQFRIQDKIKCMIFGQKQKGYTRINITFTEALTSAYTLIIYGKFPAVLSVDQARNVYHEY